MISEMKLLLRNKKVMAGVVGSVMLILAVALGADLIQRQQIFKGRAITPSAPETSLTILAPPNVQPQDTIAAIIIAKSEISAANLFVAKLTFPKNLLTVSQIIVASGSGSLVQLWAEKYYDNNTGTISLVGGVPNPGVQTAVGENRIMATVLFRAGQASGTADINFVMDSPTPASNSAIYRNSDNVNMLQASFARGATITIGSVTPTVTPTGTPAPTPTPTRTPTPTPTPPSGTITPTPTRTPTPTPPSGTITPTPTPSCVSTDPNYDVNRDGTVNLVDMSALLTHWTGSNDYTDPRAVVADIHPNKLRRGATGGCPDKQINVPDFSEMRVGLVTHGVIRD